MPLQRRALGRTGLKVTELGFGCAGFWAKEAFPERDAIALLEQAILQGINFFDTGPSYAAGNAERRLGKVLRSLRSTAELVVSTKVGTHAADDGRLFRDWSAQAVKTSVRQSLERLGIDQIPLLHLHAPSLADLTAGLLEALSDLRAEGLVCFFGITLADRGVMRLGLATKFFDSFMIEYNLFTKGNRALLDEVASSGAGAVIMIPVGRALFRQSMWPTSIKTAWELARGLKWHRADFLAARQYQFLNELPNMTGAQAALAFVLGTPTISTAIFGTTSMQHLVMNIAAADIVLPADLRCRIEAVPDGRVAG